MNKHLAETLDIEITEVQQKDNKNIIIHSDNTKTDQVQDYNLGRNVLRDLIGTGVNSIEDMKELARQSESPRAFEVLSTMMKTVADMTKDLYDLQKKTKELNGMSEKKDIDGNITVEKAVFVGSTADLLRKIKEYK